VLRSEVERPRAANPLELVRPDLTVEEYVVDPLALGDGSGVRLTRGADSIDQVLLPLRRICLVERPAVGERAVVLVLETLARAAGG
jgi:hypothetical protein